MPIEDKIMGWMKNIGNLVIPGEGGEKTDLFTPEVLPPSWVKSVMSMETNEQQGGFQMDQGLIDVLTDKLEVVEFNEEMTEVTDIFESETLEASGQTGSGGVISSFIEKVRSTKSNIGEIDFEGQTTDGKSYNFTLLNETNENGDPKFFLYSGGDKAELSIDQFVTIANNLDEKLASVEKTRATQDRWSPQSFRYAWDQVANVTVGTPYASLGNRPK